MYKSFWQFAVEETLKRDENLSSKEIMTFNMGTTVVSLKFITVSVAGRLKIL